MENYKRSECPYCVAREAWLEKSPKQPRHKIWDFRKYRLFRSKDIEQLTGRELVVSTRKDFILAGYGTVHQGGGVQGEFVLINGKVWFHVNGYSNSQCTLLDEEHVSWNWRELCGELKAEG